MRLYSSAASPFARKVRALIVETGQSGDVTVVETKGTALDIGTHPTALNPTSKIPVLERADGPALYDSRCDKDKRYVIALFPKSELFDVVFLTQMKAVVGKQDDYRVVQPYRFV